MTPQTKQLVEAVEAYIKCGDMSIGLYNAYVNLCNAFEAYKQSTEQPEAIAGEKTALEIWKEWREKDISWTDAASGAMSEYASQQTASKDQKIADLSGELHATDKLNQELQDEIAELKAEVQKVDYAYRNMTRRYRKAIDKMEAQNKNVTNLQQTISHLNKMYNQAINDLTISQEKVERVKGMNETLLRVAKLYSGEISDTTTCPLHEQGFCLKGCGTDTCMYHPNNR